MRRELFCSPATIYCLLIAVSACSPLFGQSSADREKEKAIPDIDAIAADIDGLPSEDVREDLPPSKTDTPEELKPELKGRITASEGVEVKGVSHWNEDASPFGLDFEGRGTVSLELPRKHERDEVEVGKKPYWMTVSVRPALSADPSEPSYLFIGGATIAFVMKPPDSGLRMGNAFALNGDATAGERDDWFRIGLTFPLDENNEATFPLSFSLRIDPDLEEWDLFLMNQLRYAGIVYGKSIKDLSYRSTGDGLTRLSELSVSAINPLFEDADSDGIEDAEERALGFSPEENDRYALDELGEYTNLQHFMNLRKVYPSRAAKELEATLLEAVALQELGETSESLDKLKIPEDKRRLSFTEEEFRGESDERTSRMRSFGRKPEDRSEDPPVLTEEGKEAQP